MVSSFLLPLGQGLVIVIDVIHIWPLVGPPVTLIICRLYGHGRRVPLWLPPVWSIGVSGRGIASLLIGFL